jgi:hypothetical protein
LKNLNTFEEINELKKVKIIPNWINQLIDEKDGDIKPFEVRDFVLGIFNNIADREYFLNKESILEIIKLINYKLVSTSRRNILSIYESEYGKLDMNKWERFKFNLGGVTDDMGPEYRRDNNNPPSLGLGAR